MKVSTYDIINFDISSLNCAISAAAPLPTEVQEQFEALTGGRMLEAYGLTETGPTLTADPLDNPRPNTIGLPLPDTDIRIADPIFHRNLSRLS